MLVFMPVAHAEVVAVAFRTLGKLYIHLLVKMIRHMACLALMSFGRTAFPGQMRYFIVVFRSRCGVLPLDP